MAPTVTNDAEQTRYEIRQDGALAGFAVYREKPGLIAFVHTEVDEAFAGQGLATALVADALADARARGLAVLPFCPFVTKYLQEHPEDVELVPAQYREHFGL